MNSIEKAQEILQVFPDDLSESVYIELINRISDGLEEAYMTGIYKNRHGVMDYESELEKINNQKVTNEPGYL